MRDLNYELKKLCLQYREGSDATQADRERILDLIANQLQEMGFRHMQATSLKPKHVDALVARWHAEQIAPGTFKNRMVQLRWLAEKTGKPKIIARSNDAYEIPGRVHVANISKATKLDPQKLERVTDPYTALSLRLQAVFGLRRVESIKIQPDWADRGDKLILKNTWCMGRRGREIPIRTGLQRTILNEAKLLAGKGSLIPEEMSYVNQLQRFKAQCEKAHISRVQGLRHAYAEQRYKELTGRDCPAAGGKTSAQFSEQEKVLDAKPVSSSAANSVTCGQLQPWPTWGARKQSEGAWSVSDISVDVDMPHSPRQNTPFLTRTSVLRERQKKCIALSCWDRPTE